MSDFDAGLEWSKQPTDGVAAQLIRKNVRKYRRERGRGGHRYSMNYLKTVWSSSDGNHTVLNHVDDPAWQMWYADPEQGWILISWHATRREAQAAAESRHPDPVEVVPVALPGIHVLAGWADEPWRKSRIKVEFTMNVHCQTEQTATEIEGVFSRLGCLTERHLVA